MRKVLIATTNKDKYNAVSKIFKNTIFKEDSYIIDSLASINVELADKKEVGDNIERARAKALNAYNELLYLNYDYIVGLDDAIIIRGIKEPNIKNYIAKILYEDYLSDGEEYAFERAYSIISKDKELFETTATIPYIYHENKDTINEEHTYPLSKVAYPIGYNKPINELDEEEELAYYLKYVKDSFKEFNI